MNCAGTWPKGACCTVSRDAIVVTCEHGGNRIPAQFQTLFAQRSGLLDTHRGFDRGALPLARRLADLSAAPLRYSTVSRLLVDLNRSVGHAHLHHAAVRRLEPEMRQEILDRYYHPHRRHLEDTIRRLQANGARVIHIGVHTFTPRRRGVVRRADIGLLYDPRRRPEADWCAEWRSAMAQVAPQWRVRMNYPYRGTDDGLTASLRDIFSPRHYLGLELEVNQARLREPTAIRRVGEAIVRSVRQVRGTR